MEERRPTRTPRFRIPRALKRAVAWLAVITTAGLLFAVIFTMLYRGQDQPIPFSHKLHVTDKQLSCFFCHPNAGNSSNPGMPSVEKCLLCHNVIASKFEPIARIRKAYDGGRSIHWERVNGVPDFVHFSHESHIAKGFDCGECHGNVAKMDRIEIVHEFNMRFCIDCHWKYKASDSCFTCHY